MAFDLHRRPTWSSPSCSRITKRKSLFQVIIHVAADPASSAASSLFGARLHARPSWFLLEVCVCGSLKWCVANMVCVLHGVLSQPVPRGVPDSINTHWQMRHHPNDAKRNPNDRATLGTTYISRICNPFNIMQLVLPSHLADIMVLCKYTSLTVFKPRQDLIRIDNT